MIIDIDKGIFPSSKLVSFVDDTRVYSCIIYIWKIIEGLAPNFSNPITSTFSGRRGRSCVISHVNVGRVGTLAYNNNNNNNIYLKSNIQCT